MPGNIAELCRPGHKQEPEELAAKERKERREGENGTDGLVP
jgi:hypothetical protein